MSKKLTMATSEQPDPLDAIPEHLKCPICMEVPKNKVYQCTEGHYVCDECYSKLRNCPQCRDPYGSRPIRNLAIESMLDDLSLQCPYQKRGCGKNVNRKSLQDHVQYCHYNIDKFGKFVDVCKVIGFSNCSFQVNKGNTAEAIRHLETVHGASTSNNNSFGIEFANYDRFNGGTKPIIFKKEDEGYTFVVLAMPKGAVLTWAAFYLRCPVPESVTLPPTKYKVKCNIMLRGTCKLSCRLAPVDILKCHGPREVQLLHREQSKMILSQCTDNASQNLLAQVKLKRVILNVLKPAPAMDSLILTPLSMPNMVASIGKLHALQPALESSEQNKINNVMVKWVPRSKQIVPSGAVKAGCWSNRESYVGRANHSGELIPGWIICELNAIYLSGIGPYSGTHEVLVIPDAEIEWLPYSAKGIPSNAIPGGVSKEGETLYIGRCKHNTMDVVGKVCGKSGGRLTYCIWNDDNWKETFSKDFEVLVQREPYLDPHHPLSKFKSLVRDFANIYS